MLHLALYQPEIPQNAGTLIRLAACVGIKLDIIEPCGFIFDDARLKRAGMDYGEIENIKRHQNWSAFFSFYTSHRLILLDTKAETNYLDFTFHSDDILLVGRESNGVPPDVFQNTRHQIKIAMQPHKRSLNVAVAASMVLGEALRQTKGH
ncbi:tRNA (cytidine(34)-2'-O)-methyltransferase [Candidatus Finniella inopinata]|uniref:tRNA (cytidine(34)-2'-O)-methyltransferase n=1 Tax=Candidatus Finniella inopinata TaxID=1696036 RepID=A0A4Q7DKK8_9PROT|nr:tRNA (cytidine(34)-2'-O)-methyltransferase [Candidatus Finniella inopinata]RZI46918.1 tRNA (cytidine(34)-2'-O)-methyltransferase [Candidatus Finniella inopinata]